MKTRILTTFLLAFFSLMMHGQMIEPVRFTSRLDIHDNGEAEIVFRATIDDGWHVYSTDMGSDGPISATFNVVKMEGVQTVGSLKPLGKLVSQYRLLSGVWCLQRRDVSASIAGRAETGGKGSCQCEERRG